MALDLATNITFFMYDNVKFLYKNATTYLV